MSIVETNTAGAINGAVRGFASDTFNFASRAASETFEWAQDPNTPSGLVYLIGGVAALGLAVGGGSVAMNFFKSWGANGLGETIGNLVKGGAKYGSGLLVLGAAAGIGANLLRHPDLTTDPVNALWDSVKDTLGGMLNILSDGYEAITGIFDRDIVDPELPEGENTSAPAFNRAVEHDYPFAGNLTAPTPTPGMEMDGLQNRQFNSGLAFA